MVKNIHVYIRIYSVCSNKKGKPKTTWIREVEEKSMKFGLTEDDVICQIMWIFGVRHNPSTSRQIRPSSVVWKTTGFLSLFPLSVHIGNMLVVIGHTFLRHSNSIMTFVLNMFA